MDDYPYGGGCGMVMNAQPIYDCCRAIIRQNWLYGRPRPHIVFMTAAGARYDEGHARRLATYDNLLLVCGHYEGMDERVIQEIGDEEISIGDYVLTGGELAALVVADSVLRLQPGVLAEPQGYQEESHWNGLLEYPQLHPAGGLAGPCRAAGSAYRAPCQYREMARPAEPGTHPGPPPRSVCRLAGEKQQNLIQCSPIVERC